MVHLIGIKKNVELNVREKMTISSKKNKENTKKLLNYFEEVLIISTCNRTEIYFNQSSEDSYEEVLKKIFDVLGWSMNLREFIFHVKDDYVTKHLMEVSCGFHSRILGEDQILGQLRNCYIEAMELRSINSTLQRLFQDAIACGKKFRTKARMFEIPVSSASIVVNLAMQKKSTKFMVLGYGDVGNLVVKYLLSHENVKELFIIVRNKKSVTEIKDARVKVLSFQEKNEIINNMDCIISCTSAPHTVVKACEIKDYGKNIIIFDLAVPRDIDGEIIKYERVELYDIDDISKLDDRNKKLRKERMKENTYILNKYIKEYTNWSNLREISPKIREIKFKSREICDERFEVFKNKVNKNKDYDIVKTLIDSTANVYVNRAIEVLKEEKLKGCEEQCLKIIEKIFLMKEK